MRCTFKVSIVGVGKVGATAAYSLLLHGNVTDLVLVTNNIEKSIGEKDDLEQSLPFLQSTNITLTDNYDDVAGSDVTIITAGAAQKSGEDRLDLLKRNIELFSEIVPKIKVANPNGLILVVTNPVDILTYHCYQIAEFKHGQVFGTGTLLDTARFRNELSKIFSVNPRSIHAYILGEHGDSSFPFLSSANIGGEPLNSFPEYNADQVMAAYEASKNAAYKIIKSKGATYYAIGTVITTIIKNIYADAKTVLPVSVPLTDHHGQSNVALSVPCIVGSNGVKRLLKTRFTDVEAGQFSHSADVLREAYSQATKG
jgi:L-lactate dehydrogenase